MSFQGGKRYIKQMPHLDVMSKQRENWGQAILYPQYMQSTFPPPKKSANEVQGSPWREAKGFAILHCAVIKKNKEILVTTFWQQFLPTTRAGIPSININCQRDQNKIVECECGTCIRFTKASAASSLTYKSPHTSKFILSLLVSLTAI